MPRYIADTRIICTYKITCHTPFNGDFQNSIKTVENDPDPKMKLLDWILEYKGEREFNHDCQKQIANSFIKYRFRRGISVFAKNESEAKDLIVKTLQSCRRDMPTGIIKNWSSELCPKIEIIGIYKDSGPVRVSSKFKINMEDVFATDTPITVIPIDHIFETYRWLISQNKPHRYSVSPSIKLLGGDKKSHNMENVESVDPIKSYDDLRTRMTNALLAKADPAYDIWREKVGLNPNTTFEIPFRNYGQKGHQIYEVIPNKRNETDESRILSKLFSKAHHIKLDASLNTYHDDAKEIAGFQVSVTREGFAFELIIKNSWGTWTQCVAQTRCNETFHETLNRAFCVITLIQPDWIDQMDYNQ